MDSDMILLLIFLACATFLFILYVGLRVVWPPIRPLELNEEQRGYVERANRDKK